MKNTYSTPDSEGEQKRVISCLHTSLVTANMCSGLDSLFPVAVKSHLQGPFFGIFEPQTEILLTPNDTADISSVGSQFSKMMPFLQYVCLNTILNDVSIPGIPLNDPCMTFTNVHSSYIQLLSLCCFLFHSFLSIFLKVDCILITQVATIHGRISMRTGRE